ncbi:hypothetical protein BDV95DRAFT_583695 [Massariosphaeria phaeospora]|uniref:Uncharacterized protein n=1 Tax=Massariosphaeria phaeospora TaxID=100035 RepID=A0A7C8HZW7_9PLEO|nr:hypothetical protein BDV95DRAFT_583695 [Massariosphaeria phaeospora]
MKPSLLPLRARSRPVCQLCDYILQQPAYRRAFPAASTLRAPSIRRQVARPHGALPRISTRTIATAVRAQELEPETENKSQSPDRITTLNAKLAKAEEEINWIYSSPKVEPEAATIKVLDELEDIAQQAIAIRSGQPPPSKINIRQSSAGAILSLNRDENANPPRRKTPKQSASTIADLPTPAYISQLAEDLLRHEKVFISPNVLAMYIHLQRLLRCARAIPHILHLYAHKPIPELNSSPPKYLNPSPNAAKQAIPANLAEEALTAAIEAKDMSLALEVIERTYRTPAWQRRRIFTKLGLPGAIITMMPFALYMLASEMSLYGGYIEPRLFKLYCFMGLSTYVLCTGTLGFVAITTYNHHHDRVVWRPGTGLLDRYLREDERAALDRVAGAWGFKETWRRGDEEGEDWEGLRQWIMLRSMILDKPEFLEGMNP